MKMTRNNFNTTSTHYRNGVKIDNFVFTLTNARPCVLPIGEIILAILRSSLVVRSSLSPRRLIWASHSLTWNTQTQKVVNRANKIVGFLKRNVGPGNKEVFSRLYKALVITILEYAVHPTCRGTLTLWSESNVGPKSTLSRCQPGTLLKKKDWHCLGAPVSNQGGPIYPC